MLNAPNFFIVGAPKCGTSFLHHNLRQHPQVFLPEWLKEPHFFATDLHAHGDVAEHLQWQRDEAAYAALFAEAPAEAVRRGESSVYYLHSQAAAAEIARFDPAARIIIMLRNPVDVALSLHAQSRYACLESDPDFATAYRRDRDGGAERPPRLFFRYPEVVDFAAQVARYDAVFAPEQVHLVVLEEWREDPAAGWARVLDFLDVDDMPLPQRRAMNVRKRPRSQTVHRLVNAAPLWLRRPLRQAVPLRWRLGLKDRLSRWNSTPEARPELDPAFRAELLAEHRGTVEAMEARLGRALPVWRR